MQAEQVLSRHVSATVDTLPVDSLATCEIGTRPARGGSCPNMKSLVAARATTYALGVKTVTQGVMELVTLKGRAPLPGSNVT
jgi:hypothetical protein